MKRFTVEVIETTTFEFTVDAETEDQAERMAKDRCSPVPYDDRPNRLYGPSFDVVNIVEKIAERRNVYGDEPHSSE